MKKLSLLLLALFIPFLTGADAPMNPNVTRIKIETSMGDIEAELYTADVPKTVENFVTLANKGFYNGLIFHRVIPGFMIQGGDPTGTGMSGPGYTIPDDKVNLPVKRVPVDNGVASFPMYTKGTVAMARTMAKNSAGSQFFIMVNDNALDPVYAVFGRVLEGQEIADAIAAAPRDEQDRPLDEIKMIKVTIE
jgi:cyclophilin family peptidyl-prolyl cis-trans isomerase